MAFHKNVAFGGVYPLLLKKNAYLRSALEGVAEIVLQPSNRQQGYMMNRIILFIYQNAIGTTSLKVMLRPMLYTPQRPVTTFSSAYFKRLRWF